MTSHDPPDPGWRSAVRHAIRGMVLLAFSLAATLGMTVAAAPLQPQQLVVARVLASEAPSPSLLPQNAAWQAVSLPDDWAVSRPDFGGSLWYELEFDAEELRASGALAALYIERACSNVTAYVNGTEIGTGGRMSHPYARNCFVPQLFSVPSTALRAGRNVLHLHVVGNPLRQIAASQRSSGLSAIAIGPLDVLRPVHADATWWRVSVARGTAIVLITFALLFTVLWLLRRKDSYYGWFALWIGWWGANATRAFVVDSVIPSAGIEALVVASTPLVLAGITLFKLRYAGVQSRWVDRWLLTQAIVIPALVVLLGFDHLHALGRVVYLLQVLQVAAVIVWFARWAWRHSRLDFWLFTGGDALLMVLAAVEYTAGYLGYPLKIQLAPLAGVLTLIPASIRLLWRLVESLSRTEAMNQTLEARVAEKSSEIERNYAELAALREREAALNERRRIAADLHDDLGAKLLTIAQKAPPERAEVARLAREALDEMRLSVRGMVGETQSFEDTLADWRAEAVTRLAQAGLRAQWCVSPEKPAGGLPARTQVQLTRILREAVSNVVRHARAQHCSINVTVSEARVEICVDDDGVGPPPDAGRGARGTGLANIERRARKLGGHHALYAREGGGTRVTVSVPLEAGSEARAQSADHR
ncbi:MAG: sensor histidine kinase [Burkholderiales bacterium]|nr:sensor histidine kinase [Burkholderiales bacterium]